MKKIVVIILTRGGPTGAILPLSPALVAKVSAGF
jgi:hypothetical protein